MKKNLVIGTLVISSLVQTSIPAMASRGNEAAGAIVGGIVGGLLGSQVGGGSGQKWATGIGAIAGALIGAEVVREMSESDRRAYQDNQRRCLDGNLGEEQSWRGQNASGSFKTIREGYNGNGEYCREYVSVVNTRRGREETRGIACSGRNGSWSEEKNTQQVRWGGRDDRRDDHRDDRRDDRWDHRGPGRGHGPGLPAPGPSRREESDTEYISGIRGSERVVIRLRDAVELSRIEIKLESRDAVVIRSAEVVTVRNDRRSVRALEQFLDPRVSRASVDLRGGERVKAIVLVVESRDRRGSADISVEVSSREDRPRLERADRR